VDTAYFLAIILLIIPSVIFDFLLKLKQYQLTAFVWAIPVFVVLVKFSTQFLFFMNSGEWNLPDLKDTGLALVFGYAGSCGGYLVHRIQQK